MYRLGKKSTWLQMLFWGSVWVLMQFLLFGMGPFNRILFNSILVFFATMLVVFINLEILLPKLYFRKKTFQYILFSIALIFVIYTLMDLPWWLELFGITPDHPKNQGGARRHFRKMMFRYITTLSPLIISLIGSSLYAITIFAASKEKEMIQLKSEKLKAEMDFLKSQINPHFLFNALNNIYTLSVIKSDNTPDNLLKLSGMLRYMLYDCKEDRMPLKKEIEYIDNFIDLNKLKDSRGLNIELNIDRSQPELMVAPLIFIPFIENAFKHSKIEDLEKGWIKIDLSIKNGTIFFNVKNSIPETTFTKDSVGGIGLKNVKRQLELVYPDRHELLINKTDAIFEVALKIDSPAYPVSETKS